MADTTKVKVRILRDCEGPGAGYKAGDETTVSKHDADLLCRRGFGVRIIEGVEAVEVPSNIPGTRAFVPKK